MVRGNILVECCLLDGFVTSLRKSVKIRLVYHNYDPTGVVLNLAFGWIKLFLFSSFRLVWIGCWLVLGRVGLLVLIFFGIELSTGQFLDLIGFSGFRLDWIGCLVGFFGRIGLLVFLTSFVFACFVR